MKIDEGRAYLMHYYMVEGEMTVDDLRNQIKAAKDSNYECKTALREKI